MFKSVKGFKKEDLIYLCQEINEDLPLKVTISTLKDVILNSKCYTEDPDFVSAVLATTVSERQEKEEEAKIQKLQEEKERKLEEERKRQDEEKNRQDEERKRQDEERKRQVEERERQRQHELELARLNSLKALDAQENDQSTESGSVKKKFHLPKLELRPFSGDLKDWLPFWSQFEHVHNDIDIAPENKFQYLVQATVSGSRAREVVESFPPTGANYAKAVESLKSRFGRTDLLVEFYVRELLKLVLENASQSSTVNICALYDHLESQIRALETLGVTTDKSAALLHPLVESCLPEDTLRVWQRQRSPDFSHSGEPQERLSSLLKFLKSEVESEERICLAMQGFGLNKNKDSNGSRNKKFETRVKQNKTPTAAGLFNNPHTQETRKSCVFCEKTHSSSDCFSAQRMSLPERQKILREKNCCFACLAPGHPVRKCRSFLRCVICGKKHVPLMCETNESRKSDFKMTEESEVVNEVNMSNLSVGPKVFLQTLKCKLISDKKDIVVRIVLDTGSQKSYIVKSLAEEMEYAHVRKETLVHSLFGGIKSKEFVHTCYRIRLKNIKNNFACNFEALDQETICNDVSPVNSGPWLKELQEMNITLSDVGEKEHPVQVLIGADLFGKILTGQRRVLSSGLVAIETLLGWTLLGKVPESAVTSSNAMLVTSLFVKEFDISDFWKLDSIGIKDPIEKLSKKEQEDLTAENFLRTVRYNKENRYEVHLPWLDDSVPLPNNFEQAKRRLDTTTKKLFQENLYDNYEDIFLEWLREGIIEEVPVEDKDLPANYLPHRPVIKVSKTTPIRPVFDASARIKGHPSLNDSLHSGPNLIELIPDILLRFREKKIGVIADIKKAFLQICLCREDRDFVRFLWWTNKACEDYRFFRHARVVFGVRSSPFLLGAVLKYHLEQNADIDPFVTGCLLKSFYVDNLVTSVHNELDLQRLMSTSNELMKKGGFILRDWESSSSLTEDGGSNTEDLLGLQWNKTKDCFSLNINWLKEVNVENITKRTILSVTHKVFDPFGFASPVMLCPKIMLQKTWKLSLGWDEEITGPLRQEFLQWFRELKELENINIPRWIKVTSENMKAFSIHTFCDASRDAYAAVTYLVQKGESEMVHFLASRSRISPLKVATIPRLELLAALVGARLTKSVLDALGWTDIRCFYWSDSTTVLTWITKDENWSIFVNNRVQEIRNISQASSWRHISGFDNPADLPSRGCKASTLMKTKCWWEGPEWLSSFEDEGPCSEYDDLDEAEVLKEKKKSSILALASVNNDSSTGWLYQRFSKYESIVKLVGWILRFVKNCRCDVQLRKKGDLDAEEYRAAEKQVIKLVQSESFSNEHDEKLKALSAHKDIDGIIRLKTKIVFRQDTKDFREPAVLPSNHEVVRRLIFSHHIKNSHAGTQILLNILREHFWILSGRKTVRSVISKCVSCKRFSSKCCDALSAPLPEDRIRQANVFEICGTDLSGPLFLKDGKKAWVCIFTCAVYRAVHLEIVTSLSTESFLLALRRFIARRGRCETIYCDNGTNFVGASNLLRSLDWDRICNDNAIHPIRWKFNPPSSPWWGGWWERLIGILKSLLRRILGRASLTYEELVTVICDCESVINSRPLTYIDECDSEFVPLTPAMFLRDIKLSGVPDCDAADHKSLNHRIKYRLALQKDIRKRFRSEYLGSLIRRSEKTKTSKIAPGDIVLIKSDNANRIDWPLGKVIEMLPGKDGVCRLIKLRTSRGEILRPIQRVFPLEISSSESPFPMDKNALSTKVASMKNGIPKCSDDDSIDSAIIQTKTRLGRTVKIPERLDL